MFSKKGGKRSRKKANIQRVKELADSGFKNVEIADILKIHRSTVGRLLKQADRDRIVVEARIRVIQEALAGHFDDLRQVAQRLKESVRTVQPQDALIPDTCGPRQLRISEGRGGDKGILLSITESGDLTDLHLSVEEELLFVCLKEHTKVSWLWRVFDEWKLKHEQYVSSLSRFHSLLKQEAERQSGLKVAGECDLKVAGECDRSCLTRDFPRSIYNGVCTHVFFGYEAFGKGAYGINHLSDDLYGLALGGLTIALAEQKEILEGCQQIHQTMIEHYRSPENHPEELSGAIESHSLLKEMEPRITTELEKLILKRTFHGKCDVCPD